MAVAGVSVTAAVVMVVGAVTGVEVVGAVTGVEVVEVVAVENIYARTPSHFNINRDEGN
jgi:hypothetical protein